MKRLALSVVLALVAAVVMYAQFGIDSNVSGAFGHLDLPSSGTCTAGSTGTVRICGDSNTLKYSLNGGTPVPLAGGLVPATKASGALSVTTNVIAPTAQISHVGAGLIKTITVPSTCSPACTIQLIPDAAYTYDNTGNITPPTGGMATAVVGQVMNATWDGSKWFMTY